MRALAGWGDKRLPLMPELPTFKELGYKDVEFYIWSGVFAPAATPRRSSLRPARAVRLRRCRTAVQGAMEKGRRRSVYLDAPEFRAFPREGRGASQVRWRRSAKVEEK
jgi:tripartite-type tricarboxylate transporter receptor subunit TctC